MTLKSKSKSKLLNLLYKAKRKADSIFATKKMRPLIIKYRAAAAVFLLVLAVFLPAYTTKTQKSPNYLTRYELALAIESVLDSSKILPRPKTLPMYEDLSFNESFAIYRVLSCGIMQGFCNRQFKPNVPIKNLEVYFYLQKLSAFLSKNNVHSYASRRLLRLMSYKTKDEALFVRADENNSLRKNPFETAKKQEMQEVLLCLTGCGSSKKAVLTGRAINSVNGKPISNACVVCGTKAVITGKDGRFEAECGSENIKIFAAADRYKPLELTKSLSFGKSLTLKLNPY